MDNKINEYIKRINTEIATDNFEPKKEYLEDSAYKNKIYERIKLDKDLKLLIHKICDLNSQIKIHNKLFEINPNLIQQRKLNKNTTLGKYFFDSKYKDSTIEEKILKIKKTIKTEEKKLGKQTNNENKIKIQQNINKLTDELNKLLEDLNNNNN
jgi:hypothetical protein